MVAVVEVVLRKDPTGYGKGPTCCGVKGKGHGQGDIGISTPEADTKSATRNVHSEAPRKHGEKEIKRERAVATIQARGAGMRFEERKCRPTTKAKSSGDEESKDVGT
eukprot:210980-Pleurochrysis_carterae.AAC.3